MDAQFGAKVGLRTLLALTATVLSLSVFADGGPQGSWRLVKRQLADGTVLTAPDVGGMASRGPNGWGHHSVFWKTPDGKSASISAVISYEYGSSEVTAIRHFGAFDDGSGKPVVYATPEETKRVPLKREGAKISFQSPFDPPFIVIDGSSMTATLEGVFVDYWEQVK